VFLSTQLYREVDIEYLSDRFDEPVLHVMDSIINYETGNGGLVVIKDKDGGVLCINNITGNKSSEVKFHDGQVCSIFKLM
jgi:hypothetical protein